MTFKTGERVRCIRTSSVGEEFGREGELGTVLEDWPQSGRGLRVRLDSADSGYGVDETRFELVAPEAPKVVRKTLLIEAQPEGGFLVSEPDIYIHNEAKRLAAFSALSEALEFMDKAMGH